MALASIRASFLLIGGTASMALMLLGANGSMCLVLSGAKIHIEMSVLNLWFDHLYP